MTRPHACRTRPGAAPAAWRGALVIAGLGALVTAPAAVAQQNPAPGTPATTAPAPRTPATAPPVLRNLKLPATVQVRQGHARFLVGVRLSAPARVTVTVTAVQGNQLVRTVTSRGTEKAGRVYVMVEATNEQRYQLPAGRYLVRVQATDAAGRTARPLQRITTLGFTPPRGRLDADLVPLWAPMARSLGYRAGGGQLVAAVAPRGEMARAGIRRGDVMISVNGKPTLTSGELATALRALPADTPVPVEVRRGDEVLSVQLKVSADWNATPDLSPSLLVVTRRNPRTMAYGVARALYQVDRGQPEAAQKLLATWPRAWRLSAPGQYTQGKIWERQRESKKALGAFNRALARDRRMADAALARGLALNALGNDAAAARAFADARRLDPKDASAAAFQAFSLIRADQDAAALEPGRTAAVLDGDYADAKVAEGIALISNRQRARGIVALRQGLVLTDDPARAQQIIDQYLEPNDP
ncbi:MAG TPA: PDZ domain-containing protein [Miltoncostaeaceae bacterium]|nr:PDZ domain-containing protein [Miltoncostaeaceae bacterium]